MKPGKNITSDMEEGILSLAKPLPIIKDTFNTDFVNRVHCELKLKIIFSTYRISGEIKNAFSYENLMKNKKNLEK